APSPSWPFGVGRFRGAHCMRTSLERKTDGEVQAKLMHLLTVRDIESERTERRADANARTVSDIESKIGDRIAGIAGVDECSAPPRFADPRNRLGAPEGVGAPADEGVALVYAQALVRVPAHGRVAAGAK